MILKNCTFFNEQFEKEFGDIKIENGKISEIGFIDGNGIDMSGKIVFPGVFQPPEQALCQIQCPSQGLYGAGAEPEFPHLYPAVQLTEKGAPFFFQNKSDLVIKPGQAVQQIQERIFQTADPHVLGKENQLFHLILKSSAPGRQGTPCTLLQAGPSLPHGRDPARSRRCRAS